MWQPEGDKYSWKTEHISLTLDPERGLVDVRVQPHGLVLPQILGIQIVDAVGLGPRPLAEEGIRLEPVPRQDTIFVAYKPTPRRPVECHARWRIGPNSIFDLEVSTLTPGKWDGLCVNTRSQLPPGRIQHISDLLMIHRPPHSPVSYVEMCHPHDGIGCFTDVHDDSAGSIGFRLFGHDLEKGVILRGRLRGMIMPRERDEEEARRAYEHFVREPPNLSA